MSSEMSSFLKAGLFVRIRSFRFVLRSLGRVVDGSIEATGLEVAKAAQKILQNREIWQARKQKTTESVNESVFRE